MSIWITAILGLAAAALTVAVLLGLSRARLSRRLDEQQQNVSMLLENLADAVLILDSPSSVLLHSRAAAPLVTVVAGRKLFNPLSPEYDVLLGDLEPLTPDRYPAVRAFSGETIRNELLILRHKSTGAFIYRNITAIPFVSPTGRRPRVLSIIRDETHLHRTDEARSRLASIVESSGDAIISTDTTGLITSWNRGAEKMFGYTAAEIVGTHIRRITPDDGAEAHATHVPRIMRGETVEPFNAVRVSKDGRRIDVALSIAAVRNATGEIVGSSGIARDITTTRTLERQLSQSQKMEAVGQLTGGIAHDFNNLLAIIIGNLELLERCVPADSTALRRAGTAQRAAHRCADLTKRLLAFSSREHLVPSVTDLERAVRNTLDMAAHALGPEIALDITVQPNLAPVFVDVSSFESALLNLLVNARDAMPRGGMLSIAIESATLDAANPLVLDGGVHPGIYALVSVADHGHGMTPEVLDRAFEPFYTTKERGRGTGLGLPMVYGFARKSGGTVCIESAPNAGTTVRVYLPFAPSTGPAAKRPPAPRPMHAGATILFVDDESELLEVAADYLTTIGYRVLRAENAVQALRATAGDDSIDLIVTDILMPGGVNGVELVQTIADLRPGIKVLFTSGFPATEFAQRGVTLQGYELLRKPYRLSDLREAVARVASAHTPPPAL
jgi:PAS domain S-box-containing protein